MLASCTHACSQVLAALLFSLPVGVMYFEWHIVELVCDSSKHQFNHSVECVLPTSLPQISQQLSFSYDLWWRASWQIRLGPTSSPGIEAWWSRYQTRLNPAYRLMSKAAIVRYCSVKMGDIQGNFAGFGCRLADRLETSKVLFLPRLTHKNFFQPNKIPVSVLDDSNFNTCNLLY